MNQFLPKCTVALKGGNLVASSKCWSDMVTRINIYDQSDTTQTDVMGQLLADSYDGEQTRLLQIAKFIENNAEKGSTLANSGYKTLLDAMDNFNHLYISKILTDNGLGSGLQSYTYRTLMQIKKASDETAFNQIVPAVLDSILTGKEVYIQNNVTGEYMYASSNDSSGSDNSATKILVNAGNLNDPRYIWKLKPVEFRWEEYNQESFYIVNKAFEDKILAVADGDGSLKLADATEEKHKSTWSMFYIQLVRGNIGEEVAIQCSYWGIKTLGLNQKESWKIPKLLNLKTLEDVPTSVWLLKPKV